MKSYDVWVCGPIKAFIGLDPRPFSGKAERGRSPSVECLGAKQASIAWSGIYPDPQINGKVERFNPTFLDEWACVRPYTSEQQRVDALADRIRSTPTTITATTHPSAAHPLAAQPTWLFNTTSPPGDGGESHSPVLIAR